MADAILYTLLRAVLGNLNSLALQELGMVWGMKTDLENLESTISTIQAVIQDAEVKQRNSEAVKNWLIKLKDATYGADNVLDEFATEALRRRMDIQRGVISQVSTFFSLRNPLIFRLKMGHKMKNIRERLDAIAGERSKFHLKESIADLEVRDVGTRQTSSVVNESEIYGRDEEKEKIIEILLNNLSNHDYVSVYAIWGMGGLGKTTLAQLVFNEGRVDRHFELRIWVCVSDDFDILRLTRAILESIEDSSCNISNLDPLQKRLQEKLSGKRFLLVLDDVWNECHERWNGLKDALRRGAKGSMVIVTTRIQQVALIMSTLPVHHIGCLSEDDSWNLFKQCAFGIGREENLSLERIGKEIVKKCGGVPLAVKALGSLMQFKSSEREWLSVKESEIWDLSGDENSILSALRLSYDNLPLHLRQCFAYCSIFPKDYPIEKDFLIQLWMANGFIQPRGQTGLEDIGHEIFNDLVWRSFLQVVDHWGEVACKMHDLMHDLARSIMRNECFIVEPGTVLKVLEKVRHLSFDHRSSRTFPWNDDMLKFLSLRSFISLRNNFSLDQVSFSPYISKQKYLRVLDLRGASFKKFPISVGKLKHLRYLDLSYSFIKSLPESTSCLQNLQTLKLKFCRELRMLPKGMRYMRNLRYMDISECCSLETLPESTSCLQNLQTLKLFCCRQLRTLPKGMRHMRNLQFLDIKGCDSLICMPAGMGQLTCLQTLSTFIVGQEDGHQICELKELNLEGELSIEELDNVRNSEDARSANLRRKQKLLSLTLSWRYNNKDNLPKNAEAVLDGLQPHSNLKQLHIISYQGSQFPNWMSDLVLHNLVEISLEYCGRCECLSHLGKLSSLKVLALCRMESVKYFNNECYLDGGNLFPALERLRFSEMPSLEEWTTLDRGESFPRLRYLYIGGCPKLIGFPFLPTLKTLQICDSSVMLFESVMNLTSLTSLRLGMFHELKVLPGGLLRSHEIPESLRKTGQHNLNTLSDKLDILSTLKSSEFYFCTDLENLPEGLENLHSLESLNISYCHSLVTFPVNGLQGLSSLRSLDIQHCEKLISLSEGVQYLTTLQDLHINGCPEMKSFPEGMQHLNGLQYFRIRSCKGFSSLPNWLGGLRSLLVLGIQDCQNLISLPDGLQSSNSLISLQIEGCPHLERTCKKGSGEDWPKIAHIPSIWINDQLIQSLDC
ncbi:hypothetical protein F0562_004194 [Nyssa sinensis]|uniref:Uncharacterized protein n=1 Tax=Nyssa sinensis TaxID=561372 RepID=A0A5J5BXG0_9ASTE|nr:hypothetical protein F0562_004194 [Nyssa sinensis]